MKKLENEEVLWESKNKRFLLTTHRLREISKGLFGRTIKSIMLEELTFSQLKSIREVGYIKKSILSFLLINGVIYLFNHFLFKAEIVKAFLGNFHISGEYAKVCFYFSLIISASYILLYLLSIQRVFRFYSLGNNINFSTRWMSFEEQENFISKVEEAKDKRIKSIYQK